MEQLLDFSKPIDVPLLENVLRQMNTSSDNAIISQANQVLSALKDHESAWQSAGSILEQSNDPTTKYFALQILEHTISVRWKALPKEQREGIRNYVVQKIIDTTSKEGYNTDRGLKLFVDKLNLILVQILKQEWPHNWPNFIKEIVGSSTKSEILCENNMRILKLLSEEVFDFSKDEMTSQKVKTLKQKLNEEFSDIFKLCEMVLKGSTRSGLIQVTLQTLLRFLAWIPLGYIFETALIESLLTKFLPVQQFRNDTLACLTEIASLKEPKYDPVFSNMFGGVMNLLRSQLPPETDIPVAYDNAQDREQEFIRGLSLFFSSFMASHLDILERPENHQGTITALFYLVSISMVDEPEIFKICLEFWNKFSKDLFESERRSTGGIKNNGAILNFGRQQNGGFNNNNNAASQRKMLYSTVLTKVRTVMISRMAKPEEVLVVEGDDGSIVREVTKDTDAIAQYKTMRDTLVFLTHLDCEDTEDIMLTKLNFQCSNSQDQFNWNELNTLCWAIGSISGAMSEDDEKRFLVTVIKDLLSLCEMKKGKDNKAVVASNIMYVVGQYPRFLRAHWKFLKTVVNKLFEFMHELHPGVQDMACDTFKKIAIRTKGQFVILHPSESTPFIDELLFNLPQYIRDLSPHQRHSFYEAVGLMVSAQENEQVRNDLLQRLMQPASSAWKEIMQVGSQNTQMLNELPRIQALADILRVNVKVCTSMGYSFRPHLMTFYLDMLHVYKYYSGCISNGVREQGEIIAQHKEFKVMRAVKIEILRLIETFVSKSENPTDIANNFCPPLVEPVLKDYQECVQPTRSPEVLQLFTVVVNKLQGECSGAMNGALVENILSPLFNSTLEMITNNFTDNPDHRIGFYRLLKALNSYCFEKLFLVPQETQRNVINAIVWGFKHTERNISETGMDILQQMLDQVSRARDDFAQDFYGKYYLSLLQDVLYVLTDRAHKSSFSTHCAVLRHMFSLIYQGKVKVPLGEGATNNQQFLTNYMVNLITSAFQNVSKQNVEAFVSGLFNPNLDPGQFKVFIRDFLITIKEFSGNDSNEELYRQDKEEQLRLQQQQQLRERSAIPGLLTERERQEMEDL